MNRPPATNWAGRGDRQWLIIALLLIVVLLPSATVLWLTRAAVRNERAANRERLMKAYQQQLELAVVRINDHRAEVDRKCASLAEQFSGAQLFEACVKAGVADSVLIIGQGGGLDYPTPGNGTSEESLNERAWTAANRLEFVGQKFAVAADAYAQIAKLEPDTNAEARAWMAHARCLEKSGNPADAIEILRGQLNRGKLRDAVDRGGRSVSVDAQLRAMQLLSGKADRSMDFDLSRNDLRETLQDYRRAIPSSQRLFAMQEFLSLCSEANPFPTQVAERLADQYAGQLGNAGAASQTGWNLANDPRCVALTSVPVVLVFADDSLAQQTHQLLSAWHTEDATAELVSADSSTASSDVIALLPLSSMPGRSLALRLNNPNLLAESTRQQAALYTIAGLITIAVVAIIAALIAVQVLNQLRLAQLKNDLAAVVTHELRTPLASVRVLVDTLLEGASDDPQRLSEYLQLIAQENERLSRLIENFLTFSRLQRNRQRFDLRWVQPAELIERAIAATGGKLNEAGCEFSSRIPNDLPAVEVDADALVMVLLNLLDNAVKFTGQNKAIQLSTEADDEFVSFVVSDNGIGMSPADSRRGFERFYQADTRLSRNHGGCGLGLSLVRSIVHAHGGTVRVESEIDHGSTFTVRVPIGRASPSEQESWTT